MSTVVRAEFELQQHWTTNFVFATLNALITVGTEALTEKPPIILEDDKMVNPPTMTDNCLISIVGSNQAQSIITDAEHEDQVYFINGYITYESRTDKTDEMLHALKAYLLSLNNANNISPSRTWKWYYDDTLPNSNLLSGRLDFIVRAIRLDVSTIA